MVLLLPLLRHHYTQKLFHFELLRTRDARQELDEIWILNQKRSLSSNRELSNIICLMLNTLIQD